MLVVNATTVDIMWLSLLKCTHVDTFPVVKMLHFCFVVFPIAESFISINCTIDRELEKCITMGSSLSSEARDDSP